MRVRRLFRETTLTLSFSQIFSLRILYEGMENGTAPSPDTSVAESSPSSDSVRVVNGFSHNTNLSFRER
jgi:hypothetical protein